MNGGRRLALDEAALAMLPSLPRSIMSRLVTCLIERLDEVDGDPDCDEDDAEDAFAFSALARWWSESAGPGCAASDMDAGVEDERLGFDLEDDYCLAHEDHGTGGWLSPAQRREVRRVKQAARDVRRNKTAVRPVRSQKRARAA